MRVRERFIKTSFVLISRCAYSRSQLFLGIDRRKSVNRYLIMRMVLVGLR